VLIPCRSTDSAEKFADLFVRHWHCRGFGFPTTITTDRDSRFTSAFWQRFITRLSITHRHSTARHQQSDGLSERHVRTVKEALKHRLATNSDWGEVLPFIEFALNNSVARSTGFTPFYMMFGENLYSLEPRAPLQHQDLVDSIVQAVDSAKIRLALSKENQSTQYDRKHALAPHYSANQLVLLSSDGLRSKTESKLGPKWLGPFPVLQHSSPLNVELQLPPSWRIHPVFHVSKLKPYHAPRSQFPTRSSFTAPVDPILVTDDLGEIAIEWVVDHIYDHKIVDRQLLFHTRWLGFSHHDDSWEPVTSFVNPFTTAFVDYLAHLNASARGTVRRAWPPNISPPASLRRSDNS
jgi:hypothetical protein